MTCKRAFDAGTIPRRVEVRPPRYAAAYQRLLAWTLALSCCLWSAWAEPRTRAAEVVERSMGEAAYRTELVANRLPGFLDPQSLPSAVDELPYTSAWENDADEPEIKDPGPDMGDFPNSAATLKQGRSMIEMAPLTFVTKDRRAPAAYAWPFLLRYGVTDDVEFRLLGNGLTGILGDEGTTGFSPLTFDLKVHLWDAEPATLRPASSLEVAILTEWGSRAFQGGTQQSVALNFDFPLSERLQLEWTVSYMSVLDSLVVATGERFVPRFNFEVPVLHRENLNINQFAVQWALEYEVSERLQLFVHGYYNGAVFLQQGSGSVAGSGFFWTCNRHWVIFGSCNAGLDDSVAPLSVQTGVAFAR